MPLNALTAGREGGGNLITLWYGVVPSLEYLYAIQISTELTEFRFMGMIMGIAGKATFKRILSRFFRVL